MAKVIADTLPKVVGHRGVGKEGFAPENTLKSFVLCMENNINVCYVQVRLYEA